MSFLPKKINPKAPPIKTQGIKTKIVPLIADSVEWEGTGRWIEPFVGSGSVALNICPKRALLADTNKHVINVFLGIQDGSICGNSVRKHLEFEGHLLQEVGEKHYYKIRNRFNENGDPLDFIFLNRSCFNGLMRFNRKGLFNVPFCRKPERFRPALVTKIVNQVEWTRSIIENKDWEFVVQDWRETILQAQYGDMIYCDPPYIDRHTDYYNEFTNQEADELAQSLIKTKAEFVFSMWLENKYRKNQYVDRWFGKYFKRTLQHFYHVGAQESLRNYMIEAIILSKYPTYACQSQ